MSAADPETPFVERVYRRLLAFYPPAVRDSVGRDMGDLFRDLRRAERRRSGWGGELVVTIRAFCEIPFRAFEAWRKARRAGVPRLPVRLRTDRREDVMGSILQDLKFTFRTLAKSPATTAVVVVSLALGIGANTAIFSVANAVFLRPLPYPDPDRLVLVAPDLVTQEGEAIGLDSWSYPYFAAMREHNQVFEDAAAFTAGAVNVTGLEVPDRVRIEYVTSSYFTLIGVGAALGRTFFAAETAAEAEEAVVLLGHGTWERRFGAEPDVLGHKVYLNGVEHTVVGVLPPGFEGLSEGVELWLPFPMTKRLIHPRRLVMAHGFWHNAVARLHQGTTLEQASASFPALAAAMTEAIPLHPTDKDKTLRVGATPLREARVDEGLRGPLVLLFAAVGLVLAIACANAANLLLSRAVARRREIGVRVVLGAGRGRLLRQFLTESLLLGLVAAAAGLGVAALGLSGLKAALPRATPGTWTGYADAVSGSAISIDANVLLFTVAIGLLSALAFGLAPALGPARSDVVSALSSQGSGLLPFSRLRGLSPRSLLVVTQMALALVLLVGAGLMIRSLDRMRRVDPGFDAGHVLSARLSLPRDAYPDEGRQFFGELASRLAALPGVESVSQSISLPLLSNSSSTVMRIRGDGSGGVERPVGYHVVGTDHLRTLGIPLLRGRTFRETDREGAPVVALVNRTAARRYWGEADPVGRKVWLGMGFADDQWAEVIGVVGDVRYRGIREESGPDVYVSARQWAERFSYVLLRASGDPLALVAPLRREVSALDPNLPVYGVSTLADATAESRSETRFLTLLLGSFAALAMALAATGVYGVMAYAVSSRTAELGIRMALGARGSSILRLVLSDGLVLAVAGAGVGVLAALWLTRFLSSQLYGVEAIDPPTLVVTVALLMLVALVASLWPARRAGRIAPMSVLRNE